WLYGRPFEVRSNDSLYLDYVNKLYNQIGKQIQGLYFKDGGPVVGIQIENEYQHSAAPWAITYEGADREYTSARFDRKIIKAGVGINEIGNDYAEYGQKHMQILKKMAKDAGMDVPIYTATGWGYASIVKNGSIPVMAGYAYPFWEAGNKPSPFYLYKSIHQNPDYAPVSYTPEDYPSLAAELGTGMCVTYSRRPRVLGKSFLPMMIRTVGSGSNGLGYYMYHGGTTPSDGFYMYSEGFGLNLKSYDYQAPIGEFGNAGDGFYHLKLINAFLRHYGPILAPLIPVIPETNAGIQPEDTTTLRYSVRSDGTKGFLFMHNFQDHISSPDLKNLQIKVKTREGIISFPENGTLTLKSGASVVLPFNMKFSNIAFKYATVQPLCAFTNSGIKYSVFFSIDGMVPEIALRDMVKVNTIGAKTLLRNGSPVITGNHGFAFEFEVDDNHFLIIPFEDALHAYLVGNPGDQNLIISDVLVLENDQKLELIINGKESWNLRIYPKVKNIESSEVKILSEKPRMRFFSAFQLSLDKIIPDINLTQYDDRHFVLDARKFDFSKVNDVFVNFDYRGDRAVCMLNGELATDNLYTSKPWQIGLKRYAKELKNNDMYFYFLPMRNDAPYLGYLDKEVLPDFSKNREFLEINNPEVIPEYKISIKIKRD
ncbi:MAG TPA: beta-galactosidase, partial [Bacteroidales bacterium]|nr:beta-galactosidase [Bacteroidales bacterium]